MGETTGIAWTDHTLNGWWGCVEVSPGCDNCYARVLAGRFGRNVWGVNALRFFPKKGFRQALAWQKKAADEGVRRRVFCQSMSDLFEVLPTGHPDREQMDTRRRELFEDIIPACPDLDFQLLTKRVGNVAKCVPQAWLSGHAWPDNAWIGISVVNQVEWDRDRGKLAGLCEAPIRFVSYEPALGALKLDAGGWLDWVIVGGESGSQRIFDVGWARSIIAECSGIHTKVFIKQLGANPVDHGRRLAGFGSHASDPDLWKQLYGLYDLDVREFPPMIQPGHGGMMHRSQQEAANA